MEESTFSNSEPFVYELNNDGKDTRTIKPSEKEYYVIERINTGTSTSREATSNLIFTKKTGKESTIYIDVNTDVNIKILPGSYIILNNLKFSNGNRVFFYTGTRYYK